MTAFRFIPKHKALELTAHRSPGALDCWIRRFNARHPEALIRCRYGALNEPDLLRALEIEAERFTPGIAAAKAHAKIVERRGS